MHWLLASGAKKQAESTDEIVDKKQPIVPGYDILDVLHQDSDYALYRAYAKSDCLKVLLKIPAENSGMAGKKEAFAHELQMVPQLDAEWALCPLRVESAESEPFLIFTDYEGAPLSVNRFPLETENFLVTATAMVRAVEAMHAQGIIHLDLKPPHLIVSDQTPIRTARLTGFSIARLVENIPRTAGRLLQGTLSYMSPEQTGHLSHRADERSDLYSLGVVFYQMLTGTLPFAASDTLGWMLCHVAVEPALVHERNDEIPTALSAIISKLLMKDPEDRYQSASSLGADLDHALQEWRDRGLIESFSLGLRNISDRFHIPERLYGRETEIAELRRAYERATAEKSSEFLLLKGYSGTGKTALVEAILPDVLRDRGFFASGKFDQFKRDIPYSTLIQACRKLLQDILVVSPDSVAVWRDRLLQALGGHGRVLTDVLPELNLVIGEQPPVVELLPQETQNRFTRAFKDFLGVFARPGQPLTLFLDDLHWADAGSLHLLQQMFLDPVIPHLLVLGAFRDNEVDPGHPLLNIIDHLDKAGAPLRTVKVAPLRPTDVELLVADALATDVANVRSLAAIVVAKTGCNPFFVVQFLQNLYREHLITLAGDSGRWVWKLEAIEASQFADNVVDFLVKRLEKISPALRELLPIVAFVGPSAPLAIVAKLADQDVSEITALAMEGSRENLLHLLPEAVDFVHDRVQQAAYLLVPADEIPVMHLRIGRLLVAELVATDMGETVFDIANQFCHVPDEVLSPEERRQIASICLHAGLKSKSAAAFGSAIPYLAKALSLLPAEDRWEMDYDAAYEISSQLVLCEYSVGNTSTAVTHCFDTIARAHTAEDKARLYSTLINILTTQGKMEEAIAQGVEGLLQLGFEVNVHPDEATVAGEIALITDNLGGRAIATMSELPLMNDSRMLLVTEIISELLTPALFFNRPFFHYCCALILNISLKHGVAPGTTWAAALFGALYLVRADVGRYHDGHDFAMVGNDLVDKYGFVSNKARVVLVFGDAARPYTCPLRSNAPYLKTAFDAAVEYGDLVWGAYACNHKITNMLAIGDPLSQVWDEALWRRKFVQRLGDKNIDNILLSQQCFVLSMQGKTHQVGSFSHDGFDENEFEQGFVTSQMSLMVCWYYIIKGHSLYLANRYEEASAALDLAEPLLWASPTDLQNIEYHFYRALTRLALGESADDLHGQIEIWAENCPENFAQMRDLVGAERARSEGRLIDAEELYERAISAAHESGFIHDEALAYERAALFYQMRGLERFAGQYLHEARRCYRAWGAEGKVQQLEALFPQLGSRPVQSVGGRSHLETVALRADQVDLMSVIKASQSISSQILEEPLINQLLAIVLEGAGALRAYLLVPASGEDYHVAAHTELTASGPERQEVDQVALREHLPDAIVHQVLNSRGVVLIDDASQPGQFSESFAGRTDRSVLAMPIVKQDRVIAALYLENDLVRGAFTPDRLAFIEIIAMQSAISLDNAGLYEALRKNESFLVETQKIARLGSWEWDCATDQLTWTDEIYQLLGLQVQEIKATYEAFLECVHPEDRVTVMAAYKESMQDGSHEYGIDHRIVRKDTGEVREVHEICVHQRDQSGRVIKSMGMVQDITERKQAEQKRRVLEGQLHQSRKMEVIGQLAGGVAHDFNNILQSIMGHAELASSTVDPASAVAEDLAEIKKASDHAKDLTRQLLTFSSEQEYEPRVIDLSESVRKMLKMLRPLIGENIRLVFESGLDLWPVRIDPVQIDQILANLCVNARDAIGGVGEVVVETKNHHVDESQVADNDGVEPGDYVVLVITDNGCGMDAETQGKVFEPFFTTKEMGKGTGLGLATVYGIVQQNGGHVGIRSEVGQGSSFLIYLPRIEGEAIYSADAKPSRQIEKGEGTVLLVEDDPAILQLSTRMLQRFGYTVLAAESPEKALHIADENLDSIQLLLTDVVMPGMNGRELARKLKERMPNLKLLFLSGYTANVLGGPDGDSPLAGPLLLKPFTTAQLAKKVREVMGQ